MDDRVHNKRCVCVYAQYCVTAFCPILRVLPHGMLSKHSPLTRRGQAPALHYNLPFSYPRPCHKRSDSLRCPTAKAGSVVGRSCFYLGAKKGRRTFFCALPAFCFLWHVGKVVSPCFVSFAFWFCSLVIEGAALKLLQAFRERLDLKLDSSPFCFFCVLSLR